MGANVPFDVHCERSAEIHKKTHGDSQAKQSKLQSPMPIIMIKCLDLRLAPTAAGRNVRLWPDPEDMLTVWCVLSDMGYGRRKDPGLVMVVVGVDGQHLETDGIEKCSENRLWSVCEWR